MKVEENELHTNNMMPTREKLEEYGQKQDCLRDTIKEVNKVFRPDPDTMSKFIPSNSFRTCFCDSIWRKTFAQRHIPQL